MLIHLMLALSGQWSFEREDTDLPHVRIDYLDTRKYGARCSAFIEKVRGGPSVLHRNVSVNPIGAGRTCEKVFRTRCEAIERELGRDKCASKSLQREVKDHAYSIVDLDKRRRRAPLTSY